MPTVEQLIDDEIKQLQELKRMAGKPRMLELMRQIVAAETIGNGALTVAERSITKENRELHQRSPNGLTDATIRAMKGFGRTHFNVHQLIERMQANGFKFVAKNPRIAVSSVLQKLLDREVKIVKPGAGGIPHEYENIHPGEKQ